MISEASGFDMRPWEMDKLYPHELEQIAGRARRLVAQARAREAGR